MPSHSDQQKAFLGVEASVTGQRWVERLDQLTSNRALEIAQQHGIPDLVARVLAGRGVDAQMAEGFLDPSIRDLMPDPSTVTEMEKAASRIADAVTSGEPVAIFGDYDVDGATSSALLARFLRALGSHVSIYIPDRIFEGYGPNPAAIDGLIDEGAKLIVTVDCGSTSFEALAQAQKRNIDVVVFDHHQVGVELPETAGLVNPNRQDDLSELGYLCAAGVVFMGIVAINRELRQRGWFGNTRKEPDLMQWLDLVALGTICDVVPLKGLNRAFVVRGLTVMRQQKNVGLAALARMARLDGPVTSYHLGFMLGPRINAGGRIGDASLGARLLAQDDPVDVGQIAEKLEMLNKERQALEVQMLEEADSIALREIGDGFGPSVLVTESNTWHAGIVGLLSSRLKDRYRRPAFAISFDGNDVGTGSGRSIYGADLGKVVRDAVSEGILEKGGGHAMAAGITLKRSKLGAFRTFLEEKLANAVADARDNQSIKVDGALTARSANLDLIEMVERAGPYGAGHSQPIFAFPAHTLSYVQPVGSNHIKMTLSSGDGQKLNAISFRSVDQPLGNALLQSRGKPMHLVGSLSADYWQGRRRVQLRVIDAAPQPLVL